MKASPLILVRHYLPGYRFGGQLRSIANFAAALGKDLDIRVGCLDRDQGDEQPYPGIAYQPWTTMGGARVRYLQPGKRLASNILKLLREPPHETLYLSGGFDPLFSIWPLIACRLRLCPQKTIIIAPCGELAPAALALKAFKKAAFLRVARLLRLHKNVIWHATTSVEADHIHAATGAPRQTIKIAGILPTVLQAQPDMLARGASNRLRVVFLSRICRMKNLSFALSALRHVKAPIHFSILGTIEEPDYWQECEKIRGTLPANIEVTYGGELNYADVPGQLAAQDVLFLPTCGENFGHVIFEALEMGLPIIISDKTPWRGLERAGIGHDLPLADEAPFARAIDAMAAMSPGDFSAMRHRASAYAQKWLKSQNNVTALRKLLSDPETAG